MGAAPPESFPWHLAGDDGGQGALFGADREVDRRLGVGEYRGLEFIHVEARRIVNEVRNSPFDFRFTVNPYRGCSHACSYCFARPTHAYLGLDVDEDFDRRIVVKVNAVERIRAELRSPRWSGDGIAMGTNTDPYQRAEGRYRLTRGIVRELAEVGNPFSILTKSTLILRDLDLLQKASSRTEVRCSFSIGTLDELVWRRTEPGAPHPRRRVEALARLVDAGVTTGVLVAPVIPGMSDGPEQLEEVVQACADAGAAWVSAIPLHLRPGVREHFLAATAEDDPALAARLSRRYRGAYLRAREQEAITSAVLVALGRTRWRSGAPEVPQGRRAASDPPPGLPIQDHRGAAEQLSLGW
ncbi:MAG TPA: radical SAM protein [Acidimicrobiales bacterium]|nr:radical SAM protein [Acidimicrobiales bacterium]